MMEYQQNWTIIMDYWPLFLDGIGTTLQISGLALLFSIPIGLVLGLCRISKKRSISILAGAYIEVIRGIPLLVLLLWVFFVLGKYLNLGPYWSAVSTMAAFSGAFIAEIVRAGIQSIPKEQMEAARSLGMSYFQAMQFVILPQALRKMLPPLASQYIILIKDSSLVSVISVVDLTLVAKNVVATSFRSIEVWTFVAFLYFLISFILSRIVRIIEKKYSKMGD
ncbi:amino acid ABC transporter permease [Neobacillus sp. PS3-40]|uniref:amino acid ABC transporter permease n=1 Tax=Neobacillus sp. PS3-40 TaxID=3070679 RepID=UPI0027E0D4E7|nr:amino acid ABC transporter permease [Neobacillus sp. PS3-40]WML44720.1 amino acid ABC transporter permease [Neobacillus sp. PS3-40]